MTNSTPAQPLPPAAPVNKSRWLLLIFLLPILTCSAWWGVSSLYHWLTFHPTGKIVFECPNSLCLVNADGSGYKQLTFQERDRWPAWSPDGKRIAFARVISNEAGYPTVLFVMNLDGSGLTQLTDVSIVAAFPRWLPSGDQIALTYFKREYDSSGIAVVNLQGGGLTFLTNSSEVESLWSPDGTKIVFIKYIRTNGTITHQNMYLMNEDGSNQRQLTSMYSDSPSWSPDGEKIAFTAGGIWVMNLDDSSLIQLTNSWEQSPSWSPDGQYIVYVKDDPWCFLCPDSSQLWIMKADGSQPTYIVDGPAHNPAWQPVP